VGGKEPPGREAEARKGHAAGGAAKPVFFTVLEVPMSRLEAFRQKRLIRRRYILAVLLFLSLSTSGVCLADYSFNSIAKDEKRIKLISIDRQEGFNYLVNVLNLKTSINISRIENDYNLLMEWLEKLKGSFVD
jgi:hypothetical protein